MVCVVVVYGGVWCDVCVLFVGVVVVGWCWFVGCIGSLCVIVVLVDCYCDCMGFGDGVLSIDGGVMLVGMLW